MSFNRRRITPFIPALIWSVATCIHPLSWSAPLCGAPLQPEAKIEGTITMRNGEVMNVTTASGKVVEVVLNPDTEIHEPSGVFGFRNKRLDVTALAPGLSIAVEGLQYENDQLVAKIVTLSPKSPHATHAVPSGAPSGVQVTNLADYNVKATYDAHFEAGSALLSPSDKTGLMQLANTATGLSTYIIHVQAFADFPGNNAYDQQLSRDRAEAVISYLEKTGRVPVTHIVAPGVVGAHAAADTNEASGGNSQNRRAEIKVLQPKDAASH